MTNLKKMGRRFKHKVKVGQVWRKKTDDLKLTIHKKRDNYYCMALKENGECHTMSIFDLHKYWYLEEISKI